LTIAKGKDFSFVLCRDYCSEEKPKAGTRFFSKNNYFALK
jgi:hypothetical protein